MSKLIQALVLAALSGAAAAQTGVLNAMASGDHGTQAEHAAETARAVAVSRASPYAGGGNELVRGPKAIADHGTPSLHAAEAAANVAASGTAEAPFRNNAERQAALREAYKLASQ